MRQRPLEMAKTAIFMDGIRHAEKTDGDLILEGITEKITAHGTGEGLSWFISSYSMKTGHWA